MKKTRLFTIIFLLLISGCSKQDEKVFLSFEKTQNIVLENIHFLLNENSSFFQFQNQFTQCNIISDDENMKLDSNITYSGFIDTKNNKILDLYPDIYFFDKKKFAEISTTWLIQNLYHENQYYTKLSGFSINMWKWNYESNLRNIIIDNLSGKWIKYDSVKFENIKNTQKNIEFLLNTISASSTFEDIEQVSYEWDIAYKVTIKDDILKYIKEQTDIKISDFEWLFIIRSDDQVDLRINNMQVEYKNELWTKNFDVSWIVWENEWILIFSKDGENIEISFEKHRKYIKLDISKSINFNKIRNFTTNISNSKKENSNRLSLKWDIQISPLLIYWTDLEKQLEINIKCLYENFSWENDELIVNKPESFVLLDQILGDEFSIKNFIWEK